MKKSTLILALILCLALTVFAFASCGKKKSNETSPATDAATTPATTPVTDAKTNAATTPATTPKTDAATTPKTNAATDAATTPKTNAATDAATDAATTPATTPATDAATDAATEPVTEPVTEPATDAATGCVHEWDEGDEYVIDAEPDCFTEGSKSIHCKKCGKPVPETVVVLPKQHVPEDDYEIEIPPTCCAEGLKVLYCEECGDVIEEVPIDIDPEAHKIDEWNVTEPVNMFHKNGSRTGVCIYCDETFTEGITFAPTVETFTSATKSGYNTPKVYFDDVRGDDHFYPTEENLAGNDLFVEFSILWNETLLNFDSSADPYIDGVFDEGKPFYYFSPVAGCKTSDANFSGAFEWMGNFADPIDDDEVDTPETMCKASPNYEDYPNIGGADEANPEWGWHRIGVRYHLELLDGKSGADLKDYQGTATVYLDGVAIFKLATGAPGKEGMQTWGSHLFKATRDEEDENLVEYVEENNYLIVFKISHPQAQADKTVYFVYADVIVSCGKDFVMPVQRVDDPEAATLEVAEGVEIDAPIFFRPVEE